MKKTAKEIFEIICDVAGIIGENAIEYVGYGDAENFVNFLEEKFGFNFSNSYIWDNNHVYPEGNIHTRIDRIWAYFDVVAELLYVWEADKTGEEKHKLVEEIYGEHFYYDYMDYILTALYLASIDEDKQQKWLDKIKKQVGSWDEDEIKWLLPD